MSYDNVESPKRIVTAQREDGVSYFAHVESVNGGDGVLNMWGCDSLPAVLPFDGRPALQKKPAVEDIGKALENWPSPHPGPLGFRVYRVKMPPAQDGLRYFADLHWHDTYDCVFVIDGTVTIGLDGGEEVVAKQGDFIVQAGSNHSWRAGEEGATLGIMMLGAKRVGGAEADPARYEDHSFGLPAEIAEPILLDRIERGEPSVRAKHHTKAGFF